MEDYHIKLIETAVVIALSFTVKYFIRIGLRKVSLKFNFGSARKKMVGKFINILLMVIAVSAILIIWGVDQKELAFYLSSMLAVLGIAFFAQWSLLSNITAGIILFFNHPLKIGDTVTIFDKDFNIAGKITNIGLFFMHIRNESNEKITIPNSVLLQKMVIINHHND